VIPPDSDRPAFFPALDALLASLPPEVLAEGAGHRLPFSRIAEEHVAALYPHVPGDTIPQLAHALDESEALRSVLDIVKWTVGSQALVPYVRLDGWEPLRALHAAGQPAIVVSWHLGSVPLGQAAFMKAGMPHLALERHHGIGERHVFAFPAGDRAAGAVALKRAIEHLRSGGIVRLMMDGDGPALRVPCLGRMIMIARGAVSLARVSGAPLFPMASRWDRAAGCGVVELGAPIAAPTGRRRPADVEQAIGVAALRWLDGHLQRHRDCLGTRGVERFLRSPSVVQTRTSRRHMDAWRRVHEADSIRTGPLVRQIFMFSRRYRAGRVLVVSKGDEALLGVLGNRGAHFPQDERRAWAGYYPADSAAAIDHLEALRADGAAFIVFPWSARWWLRHYRAFGEHLETRYERLHASERGVVFDVRHAYSGGR
jgi:hypothetical protein